MIELPTIWANRLNVIAANLKFGEREHRDLAATAEHVRRDYHGRFLVELIQNAADQATRAEVTDSEIVVVRTAECLGVLNQGRPLDDEGLRALTSLSYDTKDPALTIGNKGLGFKAVFQVSDAPEVYSAPMSGGGLLAEGGYRFAFSPRPLGHPDLRSILARVAAQFTNDNPQVVDEICERFGTSSFEDVLLLEAGYGAAFRFPLPLGDDDLVKSVAALGLSTDEVRRAAALVVLPFKGGADVQHWVDSAVDSTVGDRDGSSILFLTGVARIRYEDRRHGTTHVLQRHEVLETSPGPRVAGTGRVSRRVTGRSRRAANGDVKARTREWWICSRTLGNAFDSDAETAAQESRRILESVAAFPGEHWSKVDHATVDIALPIPLEGARPGQPLGTVGAFSIGLPTQMGTGMPIWVNARFHGNIARKEIDLAENAYNVLLFEEAVHLVSDLIASFKSAHDLATRRLATLALEASADSVLAKPLRAPGGTMGDEIVLAADGATFIAGRAVALPRENDVAMYKRLAKADTEGALFVLPDDALMQNARAVLKQLGASEGPSAGPDRRFLDRRQGGLSLLERGAVLHRHSGPRFWDPFVRWLLDRYSGALLADQRVLPTGTEALSTATEQVYASPILPESLLASHEPDDPQRLDRVIAARLRLFDERCLAIREADGVKYTDMGTKLRQTIPPLVREPVLADLVREVFGPRLQELTTHPGNEQDAIALLRLIAEWAQARDVKDLPLGSLRVPCEGDSTQEWTWSVPNRAYLGRGWQDPETDSLLHRAYGEVGGRLVVPWIEFARAAGVGDDDREWWAGALQRLGVWRHPRVHFHTHAVAPFQAYSYAGPLYRSPGGRCPAGLLTVQEQWDAYLERIRHRKSAVASGQQYDVERLRWVDGLEKQDVRADVVALMLARPSVYEPFLTTKLARVHGNGDATEVPSLWADALSHSGWPTIPTTYDGLVAPGEAWLLVGDQRRHRRERYRFLPCVVESIEPAQRLLLALGVSTLDQAAPERYVRALQRMAARLDELGRDDLPDAIVLIEELYRELQGCLVNRPVGLPSLLEHPLPMFDGVDQRRLRAVDLGEHPVVLVDNNPIRARFVVGAKSAAVLPLSPKRGYAALVAAIESQVGAGTVSYTSSAPVDVPFVANGGMETTVSTYLELAYPDHPLRRDIALLLGAVAVSAGGLAGERIRTVLARFDSVRLRFGSFSDAAITSFLYDQGEQGSALLVDEGHRDAPARVFTATWELVGAHRDLWASYAAALRDGTTERFLSERGVTAADVREVEHLLDLSHATRFDALKSLIFALGIASGAVEDTTYFDEGWKSQARSADSLATWIGRPDLAETIALAASMENRERAVLQVLNAAGLTPSAWQDARQRLGLDPHPFASSRKAYERVLERVVATLMATAAHAATVDLAEARRVLELIQTLEPQPELLYEPRSESQLFPHVLAGAREVLTSGASGSSGALLSRVDEALSAEKARAEATLQTRVAQREVDEYLLPAATRTQAAERDVNIVLQAASRLAQRLSEDLDVAAVAAAPRVAALRSGWWANRFAVLDALRHALHEGAPKTTRRLSEERAFRDPGPPGVLIGRIGELAEAMPVLAPTPPPTPRTVSVAGLVLPRAELDTDLARGSDGQVGVELRRHSTVPFDFDGARQAPPAPRPVRVGRGGGSGSRQRAYHEAENQDDREINGLLGEAFVYELFRERLPGFDYQCWRSTNAIRYGVASEGDDALGADFIYCDSRGVLTGHQDAPEVYIEVKATSDEGGAPFDMSVGEWETALRLHHEGAGRVYAIVRVAHVRSGPTIHRIFVDPVRLSRDGILVIEAADLRVYSG